MSLALVVLLGLAASGLTATVRAVAQAANPLWLLEKPLSCDLCMSFWTSLVCVFAWSFTEVVAPAPAVLATFGSVGVALLATKAATRLSA